MKTTFLVLVAALLCSCGASPPAQTVTSPASDNPPVPPVIHTGKGLLYCSISAKENGAQKLTIQEGTGLEFDVVVSPIVDGTLQTQGPEKGGAYRFSSHLAKPGKGTLAGVGLVAIDALETKVNVEMDRYNQPGGPGTTLTFSSNDMAARGIYVEFAGQARTESGEKYAFRVTLGQPGPGSGGSVQPGGPGYNAPIYSKMVTIAAPQTTVVTTTVTKLQ